LFNTQHKLNPYPNAPHFGFPEPNRYLKKTLSILDQRVTIKVDIVLLTSLNGFFTFLLFFSVMGLSDKYFLIFLMKWQKLNIMYHFGSYWYIFWLYFAKKHFCNNGFSALEKKMNAPGGLKMVCYVQFSSFHQKTLKNINDYDPSLKKQQ
jgi:hypothetical protein